MHRLPCPAYRADILPEPPTGDVADRAVTAALAKDVVARHGPVSVLTNAAGIGRVGGVFAVSSRWDEVLGVKLTGAIDGVQPFVRAIVEGEAPALSRWDAEWRDAFVQIMQN